VRALFPVLAAAFAVALAAPSAQASSCHDATSSFTKLQGVTCAQAKAVVAQSRKDQPPYLPECKGDPSVSWHGWRFTAIGSLGIEIVVRKGAKSFHFGGGGACS
jgi:hypothetical protein